MAEPTREVLSEFAQLAELISTEVSREVQEEREGIHRRLAFLESDVRTLRRAILMLRQPSAQMATAVIEAAQYFRSVEGRG